MEALLLIALIFFFGLGIIFKVIGFLFKILFSGLGLVLGLVLSAGTALIAGLVLAGVVGIIIPNGLILLAIVFLFIMGIGRYRKTNRNSSYKSRWDRNYDGGYGERQSWQ
ncbi:MAG: hypothetical protein JEY99_09655 [Spirochaetales bacterium]|nr:hypothetical protein [Spirochaetales bacterium]